MEGGVDGRAGGGEGGEGVYGRAGGWKGEAMDGITSHNYYSLPMLHTPHT